MRTNPYSLTSTGQPQGNDPMRGSLLKRFLFWWLKFFAAYSLGIISCMVLTPVEAELAGIWLWSAYLLAPVGLLLSAVLLWQENDLSFGKSVLSVALWVMAFTPCVLECVCFLWHQSRLGRWRPLWVGFPIGFIGTLGMFFSAQLSI